MPVSEFATGALSGLAKSPSLQANLAQRATGRIPALCPSPSLRARGTKARLHPCPSRGSWRRSQSEASDARLSAWRPVSCPAEPSAEGQRRAPALLAARRAGRGWGAGGLAARGELWTSRRAADPREDTVKALLSTVNGRALLSEHANSEASLTPPNHRRRRHLIQRTNTGPFCPGYNYAAETHLNSRGAAKRRGELREHAVPAGGRGAGWVEERGVVCSLR